MVRALNLLANMFPVWVVACSGLALWQPTMFRWFEPYIVPGLGVIMLGMGITLSVDDFRKVLQTPKPIAVGFAGQFLIMPFLGWAIARAMNLPTEFAVGLILVSCCPGGTASNVVTYIARANLPLSLLMTMSSTFGAIALTPLLTKLLAGQLVPVANDNPFSNHPHFPHPDTDRGVFHSSPLWTTPSWGMATCPAGAT